MKKIFWIIPWVVLAIVLTGCGKSGDHRKAMEEAPLTNEVTITFASANAVMKSFNRGVTMPVRAAFARNQEEIVEINFSNLADLACDNEFPDKTENNDFIMSIMLRKGDQPLAPGEYEQFGLMFSSKLGPYVSNSPEGSVYIEKVEGEVVARFHIWDDKISLRGDCTAPWCGEGTSE